MDEEMILVRSRLPQVRDELRRAGYRVEVRRDGSEFAALTARKGCDGPLLDIEPEPPGVWGDVSGFLVTGRGELEDSPHVREVERLLRDMDFTKKCEESLRSRALRWGFPPPRRKREG